MAIKQDVDFKSIPVSDAYIKIDGFEVVDRVVDGSKVYRTALNVAVYPSSDKVERLYSKQYAICDLEESELDLKTFYTKLKEHEDFENAVDC